MSVDGGIEQLQKLGCGEEKPFKPSVLEIDSLQIITIGRANMVVSAVRVPCSTQRWHQANRGKVADVSARAAEGQGKHPCVSFRYHITRLSRSRSHVLVKADSRWCFCYPTSVAYQNVGIILKEGAI